MKRFRMLVAALDRRSNFVLLTIALLSVIGCGAAYREFSHVLSDRFPDAQTEARRFERQLVIDELVDQSIAELGAKLNAHRVIVWRFSNGSGDISGIPFSFVSPTSVWTGPGIAWDDSQSVRRPLSIAFGPTLRVMWANRSQPVCAVRHVDDAPPAAADRMRARGTVVSVLCPLTGPAHQGAPAPVGLIGVEYIAAERVPADQRSMFGTITATAGTVYRLLASVHTR